MNDDDDDNDDDDCFIRPIFQRLNVPFTDLIKTIYIVKNMTI